MKKILMILAALATFAWAGFAVDFDVETNLTVPLEVSSIDSGVNLGGTVGVDVMFTDKIGAGIDFTFYTPIYGLGYTYTDNVVNIFYVSGFGSGTNDLKFDIFAGVAIKPINTEKNSVVLTPGFDLNIKRVNASNSRNVNGIGYGVGLDVKYSHKFSDHIAMNAGALTTFSFFENGDINGLRYGFCPQTLRISPRIGCGFYF